MQFVATENKELKIKSTISTNPNTHHVFILNIHGESTTSTRSTT